MKAIRTSLAVLLGLQFVMMLWVFWQSTVANKAPEKQALLSFKSDEVTKITLENDDGESSELVKQNGTWQITLEDQTFPVEEQKLTGMLDKLQDLSVRWPVADTQSGQKRMKVADGEFKKQVKIFSGDQLLAHTFVGTSPSFRKVYLRRAGDNNVYAANVNQTEIVTKADDWLEKNLLALNEPQNHVTHVVHPHFEVSKTDDEWVLKPSTTAIEPPENWTLEQAKVDEFLKKFANLRILTVASAKSVKTLDLNGENNIPTDKDSTEEALATVNVKNGNEVLTYRFAAKDGEYYVKRDDQPATFTLAKYQFDHFVFPSWDEWMVAESEDSQDTASPTESMNNSDASLLNSDPAVTQEPLTLPEALNITPNEAASSVEAILKSPTSDAEKNE